MNKPLEYIESSAYPFPVTFVVLSLNLVALRTSSVTLAVLPSQGEGVKWIRGDHAPGSPEAKALLVAYALSKEEKT